jgi:hypothetical protein
LARRFPCVAARAITEAEEDTRMSVDDSDHEAASKSREAWRLVRSMLDDMTRVIEEDAESELGAARGLAASWRASRRCAGAERRRRSRAAVLLRDEHAAAPSAARTRTASTTWR